MYDPPGLPPPGWYPDPQRPGASRWWDGSSWAAPAWSAEPPGLAGDALPETGAMLGAAFRRALRRWRALAVLGLVGGALPAVFVAIALVRLFDDLAIVDDEFVGWSSDRLPAVGALVLAAAVAGMVGWLAMAWLMLHEHDDEAESQGNERRPLTTGGEVAAAGTALLRAGAAIPRALLWGGLVILGWVLAMALLVGSFVVVWPLGILLVLAYIPLGVWLWVKLAFVTQAVLDGPGNPLRRSFAVSRGRFWPVFGRVLLAGVIAGIINYGVSTVTSIAAAPGTGFGTQPAVTFDENGDVEDFRFDELFPIGPVSVTLTAIGAMATSIFATSMLHAALTELYRTRERRRV